MKPTIAVIAGGDSSEFYVSLRSAELIFSSINQEKYNVYILELKGLDWEIRLEDGRKVPVDRNDFSFLPDAGHSTERIKIDFAYITIHGTPGENGILQGYLDMMRIPHSTCGVLASALTFNKFACNQYLKGFGVRVAESLLIRKGHHIPDEDVIGKIGLPCFVKPNQGGSSFGITKVKTKEEIQPAIRKAFEEDSEVIVEAFMQGPEITCGCYKTSKSQMVLPLTEIVSKNEYFDYEAKYDGASEEITPARIPEAVAERIKLLTSAIYDIIGCKGFIRADYIITEGDKVNLLEVNTTPGMTAASLVPQQIKAAGLDLKEIISEIIEDQLNA